MVRLSFRFVMFYSYRLFYLCSRGVAPAVARRLLCEGFLQQCVDGPLADAAGPALVAPLQDMEMT